MALSIGIVGLPNVGKSTLFNALSGASVLAANYPFATKDPNVGVVPVPDERLKAGLDAGRPARAIAISDEEKPRARELFLLTGKPVLYVANVDEGQLGRLDSDPAVRKVAELAMREGARWVAICGKVEAEI